LVNLFTLSAAIVISAMAKGIQWETAAQQFAHRQATTKQRREKKERGLILSPKFWRERSHHVRQALRANIVGWVGRRSTAGKKN